MARQFRFYVPVSFAVAAIFLTGHFRGARHGIYVFFTGNAFDYFAGAVIIALIAWIAVATARAATVAILGVSQLKSRVVFVMLYSALAALISATLVELILVFVTIT